jgi:hypothetical protein
MRTLTIVFCAFDTLVAGVAAVSTLGRIAEPATHSFDLAAGYAILALFLLTTAPAIWLSWRRRSPRLALSLSLGFPVVFVLLFVAAIIAFV